MPVAVSSARDVLSIRVDQSPFATSLVSTRALAVLGLVSIPTDST